MLLLRKYSSTIPSRQVDVCSTRCNMMGPSLTPDTLLKHILSYPEYLYQKEEYSYAFLKNSGYMKTIFHIALLTNHTLLMVK